MTLSEYKKEITAIFRRNTYRGYADWRQCGRLAYEMDDFLYRSRRELLREGREKDLFEVTCRAFVKWGTTDKDDSNGETQDFAGTIWNIWDDIYESGSAHFPHEKMLAWFMSKIDGSLIDYMEDILLDYVMEHFKEPDFLVRKLDFLHKGIADLTEKAGESSWYVYKIERYKQYVVRIMSEQGQPIELIRDYAKDMTHPGSQELLADIEQQYGNKSEAIAIYEKLAAGEKESWGRHDYNIKLKDIYKENGLQTKYEAQLKRLLYMETGSKELLEEYKATVPPEDWEKVRDRLFDSFKPGDCRALHWYAQEGCMERLMEGVEACGYTYLKEYRKLLEGKYPERCLAILMKTADKDAERANKRQDYQHVARILRWMRKYPGGEEKAADLAAKYREAYPRRRAMIEELEGI